MFEQIKNLFITDETLVKQYGYTALLNAINNYDTAEVEKILSDEDMHPITLLRFQDENGRTPLHIVAERGSSADIKIIEIMLSVKDLNIIELLQLQDARGTTPLHRAMELGFIGAVQTILSAKNLNLAEV